MADWSQLPPELLQLISNHLNSDLYLIRFRSVCSTWRNSTTFPNPNHHHQKLPSKLPLLSNSINDPNTTNKFTSFSLSKRTLFLIFPPPQDLTLPPPPHHHHYHPDDRYPWIIKINNSNNQLLNPLSHYLRLPRYFPNVLDFNDLSVVELGHEFVLGDAVELSSLPSSVSFNNLFLGKVVLFEVEGRFFLLTIQVSGKLAVFRLGDDRWSIIPEMLTPYDDICVFKGKPYAVDGTGRTVGVGIEQELGLDLVADPVFGGDKKYLVESNGELLLVDKYMFRAFDDDDYNVILNISDDDDDGGDDDDEEEEEEGDGGDDDDDDDDGGLICGHNYGVEWVVKFDIYKLDEKEKRWVELTKLRDRSLFLGDDCAFSLSTSEMGSSCFGDCVIFRDDAFHRFEFEMGLFDLDIRKSLPLQKDYHGHYDLIMPPDWVKPPR